MNWTTAKVIAYGKRELPLHTHRCHRLQKQGELVDWLQFHPGIRTRRKWTLHRRCSTSNQFTDESEVAYRSWPVRCFRLLSQKHPDKRMWCFTTRVQNAFGAETQPRLTASHAKQQKPRLTKNSVDSEKTPELHYIPYC